MIAGNFNAPKVGTSDGFDVGLGLGFDGFVVGRGEGIAVG